MSNFIGKLGDKTSKEVKPDFESEKFYHWQHMRKMAEKSGTLEKLPYKPRRGLAEESFFEQVDRRVSRVSFSCNISFDENGNIVRSLVP